MPTPRHAAVVVVMTANLAAACRTAEPGDASEALAADPAAQAALTAFDDLTCRFAEDPDAGVSLALTVLSRDGDTATVEVREGATQGEGTKGFQGAVRLAAAPGELRLEDQGFRRLSLTILRQAPFKASLLHGDRWFGLSCRSATVDPPPEAAPVLPYSARFDGPRTTLRIMKNGADFASLACAVADDGMSIGCAKEGSPYAFKLETSGRAALTTRGGDGAGTPFNCREGAQPDVGVVCAQASPAPVIETRPAGRLAACKGKDDDGREVTVTLRAASAPSGALLSIERGAERLLADAPVEWERTFASLTARHASGALAASRQDLQFDLVAPWLYAGELELDEPEIEVEDLKCYP